MTEVPEVEICFPARVEQGAFREKILEFAAKRGQLPCDAICTAKIGGAAFALRRVRLPANDIEVQMKAEGERQWVLICRNGGFYEANIAAVLARAGSLPPAAEAPEKGEAGK